MVLCNTMNNSFVTHISIASQKVREAVVLVTSLSKSSFRSERYTVRSSWESTERMVYCSNSVWSKLNKLSPCNNTCESKPTAIVILNQNIVLMSNLKY